MALFGHSIWDLLPEKTTEEFWGNELEAGAVSDTNEALEAHQQILQKAKEFMETDEYKNASEEDKQYLKDSVKKILAEIQPMIKGIDQYNEALATSDENRRRQHIAQDTVSKFDELNDEDGLLGNITGQSFYALTDAGKNAYENTINQAKAIGSIGANIFGYKDTARNLADEIMQSQMDMNAIMTPAEYNLDNGILGSQNIRFATNSASQLASLIGSPVNVAVSKGVGALASGLGKVTGLTSAAEKFFGAAAGSGAEGIAAASNGLLDLSKVPQFFGAGLNQVSKEYAKGMLGYALGKTASALPTWASMSLPELYKDALEYDENGNVVIPDGERMAHIATLAIPHAIIENFGINPQSFGTVAERLTFKQYFKQYFKALAEEPSEELYQNWIGKIEKEWGKEDPSTGKKQNLADAIYKASQQFSSTDKQQLQENLNEALGGFFGALAMFPADHKLATTKYLQMQEQYRKTLDNIVKGVDQQANLLESMGIADFSDLRQSQKDLEDVGRLLQAEEQRLKDNKFKDGDERRSCIQQIANLKQQAAQIGAELQDAAENTVKDYAAGMDILNQMQQDYYNQQLAYANQQLAREAQISQDQTQTQAQVSENALMPRIDQAKEAGQFDTSKYQPAIDQNIKTYKGKQQLINEALKRRDAMEEANPKLKQERLAIEAENQKKIDEENAKGKPKSRTKAELDKLMEEYRNGDFVGNFNDFLRAKDAEEAQAEQDIEAEAQKEFGNTETRDQKIARLSRELVENREKMKQDPQNFDQLQKERAAIQKDLNEALKQTEDTQKPAPEGFRYTRDQDGKITLERDPNFKRSEQDLSSEALKTGKQTVEGLKNDRSTKIGNETIYDTKKDAEYAAAKMLEQDVKDGKVKQGTKLGERYNAVKTKYGYVIREAKKAEPRTKTLNGKNAVDKSKAEKKIAAINDKLQKRKKKNKKGKNVKVVLVEDQKQIPNFQTQIVRNAVTGVYEKAATYVEGASDQNGNETTIYIVRNNIEDEKKLDSIITHELVHAGLRNVLNKNQQRYLLHETLRLLEEDRSFRDKIMPEMAAYGDLLSAENILENNGLNVFLEEVLARLAETMDAEEQGITGKMRKIWNNIVSMFYRSLRSLGLTTNLSKAEIPEILKGLKNNLTGTGSLYHFSTNQYGYEADAKAMFRADNMKKAINKLAKRGDLVSYDIDGKPMFSLRTWEDGGRSVLAKYLKTAVAEKELSDKDAKSLLREMDSIYKECKIMANKDPESEFGKWSKVGVDYDSEGKPYFTVVRQNGDYAMNIDFSTVCKKRRALNNVLNEIVKRGYLAKHGDLTKKDVVDIQEAIKAHGFEVACALCFVDSKRYNIGNQAKNIVSRWNKMFKSYQEGTALFKDTMKELQQQLAKGKKAKNQEQRIAQAISSDNKEDYEKDGSHKYRRMLTVDWLISSGSQEMLGGHDNLAKNYPRIFEVLNGYGSGKSKNSHMDVAWNNDIIASFNARNNPNVTSFNPEKAFSIGGVRIQSFSDFIPTMFFDYVQCISELEAKKLPSHAYTKEADFVKLFGSCGIKTNMSFVYAEHGCKEINKTEFDRIRKEKGDAYVTSYDEKGKTKYFEYLYTDLDPQHPQSFNPEEAFRLRADKRYEDSCGTIAVGVSDQHVITLLRDKRIDQVIPYHKSGIAKEVAMMRHIYNYADYTQEQTERDKVSGYLLSAKGDDQKAALRRSGAYGKHFDFYGDLAKTNDPKKTAKNYLKWCKDNNLKPKFEKFTGEENYYKLLADFKLYKQDAKGNDIYIPQQAVKLNLNNDWQQVLTAALDVNQKVADRFNSEIDNLLAVCKNILDDNKELAKIQKKGVKGVTKVDKKTGRVTIKSNRFSLGGMNAQTANIQNYENAMKMLEEGKSAQDVWFNTGWYVAKDGKPRFEISDKEYDVAEELKNARIDGDITVNKNNQQMMLNTEYPINKIIKHDDLFKAYPELEQIRVNLYEDAESKSRGSFGGKNISINLSKMLGEDGTIDPKKIKRTLIHELQHGIQRIEGFAVGSSKFAEKNVLKSEYGRRHKFTQEELDEIETKADDRYRRHYGEGEARAVADRLRYYDKDKESGEFLRKYGNMPEQDFDYDADNSIIAHDENFVNQNVRYSLASTKDSKWLENSKKIKVYRAMVLLDGKLYPPMSTKVRGVLRDPVQFGKWYRSDEDPSIITKKKIKKDKKTGEEREIGYIRLEKSNGKNLDDVAYNPYWHASVTMLNDQFTSAWDRPELVVVECEIAEDDINEKYRADFAKDYIGKSKWHSGTVSSRLQKLGRPAREVYLSRYIKALRIVPNAEVAKSIADMVKGTNVEMPENVVTPEVLQNLKKLGVKIGKPVGLDPDFVQKRRQESDNSNRRYSLRSVDDIKDKYADFTDYFSISENNQEIKLSNLVVKPELRKSGIGQHILNDIIKYADDKHKRIVLTPTNEFGKRKKLIRWYKRNGFVENKGRNTDFSISETMYKNPINNNTKPNKKNKRNVRYSLRSTDKEYAQAVKDKDLKKARALLNEAAKKAGYDGSIYYHGNRQRNKILEFKGNEMITEGKEPNLIKGYFTDQKKYAKEYGDVDRYFVDTSDFLYVEKQSIDEMKSFLERKGIKDVVFNDFINDNKEVKEWLEETGEEETGFLDAWMFFNSDGGNLTHKIAEAGYKGVMWDEGLFDQDGGTAVMPFSAELIKSAKLITRDDEGNIIPPSERFNRTKKDVRFSLRTADPFYSNTLDALNRADKKLPESQKAQSWLSKLSNLWHKEEAEWMGLPQWLKSFKPADKVTKQQIVDFINANQVKINEVNFGGSLQEQHDKIKEIVQEKTEDYLKKIFDENKYKKHQQNINNMSEEEAIQEYIRANERKGSLDNYEYNPEHLKKFKNSKELKNVLEQTDRDMINLSRDIVNLAKEDSWTDLIDEFSSPEATEYEKRIRICLKGMRVNADSVLKSSIFGTEIGNPDSALFLHQKMNDIIWLIKNLDKAHQNNPVIEKISNYYDEYTKNLDADIIERVRDIRNNLRDGFDPQRFIFVDNNYKTIDNYSRVFTSGDMLKNILEIGYRSTEQDRLLTEVNKEWAKQLSKKEIEYGKDRLINGIIIKDREFLEGKESDIYTVVVKNSSSKMMDDLRKNYFGETKDTIMYPIEPIHLDYTTDGLENKREIAFTFPAMEGGYYPAAAALHFADKKHSNKDIAEGKTVVWTRFGDYVDEDGSKILVVDEIQSALHQDARERGYKDINENPYGIPNAPFKQTYDQLAMKRLLRLAAEEGYAGLALITPEQQNVRNYSTDDEDEDSVKRQKAYKAFYGERIPNFLNKFLKPFGVKVKNKHLDLLEIHGNNPEEAATAENWQYVEITPEMRETFLSKGMPRFSLRNPDGSKKTNQELWREQQAKFSKIIQDKLDKEKNPQKRTLRENLAYMADRAEYNFTNKRHFLKKWQTDLEKNLADDPDYADLFENGRLKDKFDLHMMFDTYHGKVQTKRDEFTAEYWNPIYESVTKNGVRYDDLNRYLFARHAEERDRHVQSINPEYAKEGHGSGWNDEWGTPDEVIESIEKKYGKNVMQDIGTKFDKLNDKLLDWQVRYHLISQEAADTMRNTYKHYTPLKRFDDYIRGGWDEDPHELNISQDIRAKALGRKSAPEHMLTFVKANIDTVFRRGERNLINLALLDLALRTNDPIFDVNRKLVKRISKDGEVEYVRDLTGDKEQTVGVRDGDKYYTVHIGNREIYNAFDSDEVKGNEIFEALVHSFRGITSTMGANATSRNIEFGLVNLDKDQQQALAENLVYRSKKGDFWNFAKNAIKNIPSAAKTFIQYAMGKDNADTRMFREFLENGGSTGYMDVYRLVDDAKDLEARIDEATLGFFEKWKKWKDQGKITQNMIAKAKEVTGRLLKPLELINDLFEQTTRFANYKTARKFMSAARAAELSKNLTLNFNRHGKMWRSQWNWMYMFSNASLQGTAKTMRMYEKAFSQNATPEQRKAARSILMFSFGAGIMAEILGHAFSKKDDDDLKYYDKLEASIKDNNVVIMNPASKSGKNYIKLPLFIGGAFPYMMGRNAAAMMIGSQTIGKSVSNVVQNMEDYFSPLGTAAPNKEGKGDIVKKVAPTSLRPFLDVSYNSNFAGSRIYAQSMNSNKPAYTRAFKKTPMFYVELSRILSKITGGNTLEKGSVDIPPEAIQHIVESYAGGTGKFVGRTLETARKIVKGEELDTGNIPIVRRFTDDVGDSHVYDEFRKIQEVYRTVTTAEKDRNQELLEKYPKHRNLVNLMKRYNPRLTRLNKKLERNQIDMDTYRNEYVSILKQINKDGRKYIQQK